MPVPHQAVAVTAELEAHQQFVGIDARTQPSFQVGDLDHRRHSLVIELLEPILLDRVDLALVLDDYHLVDAKPIHDMMAFLLENLPEQMHILNVSFLVPELRRNYGGCAGNIAFNLQLLGGDGLPMATVGVANNSAATPASRVRISPEDSIMV